MRKALAISTAVALAVGLAIAAPMVPAASALSPNVSFGAGALPTWQVNNEVWAMTQASGLVVAGGDFTSLTPPAGSGGSARAVSSLAILNAETGNPTSCQIPVTYPAGKPTVRALATAPDGKTVYVGGDFSTIGGINISRLAAIDPATCTVLPFRPPVISSFVRAIAVDDSGVYFGGDFLTVDGQTRQNWAAVSPTGQLLPWAPQADNGGIGTNSESKLVPSTGRALAFSPDGSMVAIGGDFFNINGQNTHSIAVVDSATGANVRNYPRGFIPDTSVTKAIVSSGNSFYVGNEGTGGGVFDGRFAVDWTTLDQTWRDTCLGATQALAVYGNALYSASHAHDCSSMNEFPDDKRNFFNAETLDTGQLLGWSPNANDGIGEQIGPRAMTVATGTTTHQPFLWYGGEFTRVNGAVQQGLTRFGTADNVTPPTPSITAEALTAGAIQVRVRTVVDNDDSDLTYSIFRNGASTPIWTGKASSRWWTRPQVSFVDSTVTPGTTYTYRVSVTDGTNTSGLSGGSAAKATATGSSYAAAIFADSPSLFWQYDGSSPSIVQDKSGATLSGLNGIPQMGVTLGQPGPISGDSGSSALFDGSTGYIWNDQLKPAPSTYSIETWFKTTSTAGGKLIGYGNGRPLTDDTHATRQSSTYDRQVYMDNAGHLFFGAYPGYAATVQSANSYNDGSWHQVTATQGPAGMVLYIDGVRVARNTISGNQDYYGVWHVGGDNLSAWPNQPSSNFFGGNIADTAIYPGVLNEHQVAAHYEAGGGVPAVNAAPTDTYGAAVFNADPDLFWRFGETSGDTAADSSFTGTAPGVYGTSAQHGTDGPVGDGHDLITTGTDDSIAVEGAQVAAPAQFSIETWFKSGSTSGGKIVGFENTATGPGSNYDKQVYLTDDGSLVFGIYVGGFQYVQSAPGFNDSKWHHIVATQDSSGMTLLVDGTVIGTNPTTTNQNFQGYWRLGGGNLGGWPGQPTSSDLTGEIDDTAIYSTPLSTADAQNHYRLAIADSTPPSVPQGVTAANSGTTNTVSWTASTDNVGVGGYTVYRGTTADFVADATSQIATATQTSYADTGLPPGTYYYRVQAQDTSANPSGPSASASATVADTEPPTAPTEIVAAVAGSTVNVSWTAATDNVAVAEYRVYRGTIDGFTPSDANLVGTTATTTFVDSSLALGSYYYAVEAVDTSGLRSTPATSGAAIVADTQPPTAPTGLTATVTVGTVDLSWAASTDDVGVTGYSVYRGTTADFTPSSENLLSTVTSTAYSDQGAGVGTSYYKVIAFDAAGNTSTPAVVASGISDTTPPTAPQGLTATVTGMSVGLTWTASTDNVAVTGYTVYRGATADFPIGSGTKLADVTGTTYTDAAVPAGDYYYEVTAKDAANNVSAASAPASATVVAPSGPPVVLTTGPSQDAMTAQSVPTTNLGSKEYLAARGAASSPQASFLSFPIPVAPAGSVLTSATLQVRTTTDPTSGSTDAFAYHLVNGTFSESSVTWNTRPTSLGATLGTLSGATALNTSYTTTLDASALARLTGQTVSIALVGDATGNDNVRLYSKETASTTYRPLLTLTYTPGTPPAPDTTAPTVPAGVNATATGSASTVTWTASTDNVGVTGYSVYRGATADFAADATSKVGDATETSFGQTGLTPGTYYYRVTASDRAGNISAASSSASVTVAQAPVVQTVPVSEDAMVAQGNPGGNYGSAFYLAARATAGTTQSFLKFAIPATPAGMKISGASLAVRTTTEPAAGSAGSQTLSVLLGDWSEGTVTWNSRPTTYGATLGTLTGATAPNTSYTITIDPAGLAGLAGTTASFALLGTPGGADDVRLWSKNASTASYRPVLTLTYTAE